MELRLRRRCLSSSCRNPPPPAEDCVGHQVTFAVPWMQKFTQKFSHFVTFLKDGQIENFLHRSSHPTVYVLLTVIHQVKAEPVSLIISMRVSRKEETFSLCTRRLGNINCTILFSRMAAEPEEFYFLLYAYADVRDLLAGFLCICTVFWVAQPPFT